MGKYDFPANNYMEMSNHFQQIEANVRNDEMHIVSQAERQVVTKHVFALLQGQNILCCKESLCLINLITTRQSNMALETYPFLIDD